MGKFKQEASGDSAPSRAAYFDVGRFRLTKGVEPHRIWIRDMESGEAGSFDAATVETALLLYWMEAY